METTTFDHFKKWVQKELERPYTPNPSVVSPQQFDGWMRKYIDEPKMPAYYGNVNVTIDGVPVHVEHIQQEPLEMQRATKFIVEGWMADEDYIASTGCDPWASISGSGYARKEVKMREGTQGSYAYGVAQLAEGLSKAVSEGWITDEEAKTEFRANVDSVNRADQQAKYEADRIEALEKELAELKGNS